MVRRSNHMSGVRDSTPPTSRRGGAAPPATRPYPGPMTPQLHHATSPPDHPSATARPIRFVPHFSLPLQINISRITNRPGAPGLDTTPA